MDRSQIDEPDRRLRRIAVGAIVRCVEGRRERAERVGRGGIERHFQVIPLAGVANVGEVAHRYRAAFDFLVVHQRAASLVERVQAALDLTQIEFLFAARQGR